ncbi:MAG: hypothetical protein JO328_11230 [Hyphomicrobiales bacterium]|nr:hypothetical protein [Hyphomicrobiales bacterium]MBV8826263.1 hypothetical protein [Hyphomicrobiales bacterium]MBV9429702.1 hypothetical protein [Bradyrhizobiaceae bacterium]
MRESALFGTMFGLGAGAVLVGVTVSRLVGGQVPEKPVEEPTAAVVEAPPPAAAIQSAPPPAVAPVAPPAVIALSGQHRMLSRKHHRPPTPEEAVPKPAPLIEEPAPTASIATREAPPAAPPMAQVTDDRIARDAPIAIVRGGVVRPALRAPGPHIIHVQPPDR